MTYKRGSTGQMVKRIQEALKSAGLGVIPDGIFGAITEEAVRAFQRENGLEEDGTVGKATITKLLAAKFSIKKSRRKITDIVIHCTASAYGQDLTAEDVRRIHKAQGWSDIGYHYLIRLDGRTETGRDVDIIGAHVSGHNAHSIGVCYVGGIDQKGQPADTRTANQKDALICLLKMLRAAYPDARICGHRDFPNVKKSCPCFDAKTEYSYLSR